MTIQDIGLFHGLAAKMDYLNQRQGILAQNIANSDTPGYRPKDLQKADFTEFLGNSYAKKAVSPVSVAKTDEAHMAAGQDELSTKSRKQKNTYEVAPAGNAVIIEEQLLKSGRTVSDYNLMVNIYQKHMGMIRTALGQR